MKKTISLLRASFLLPMAVCLVLIALFENGVLLPGERAGLTVEEFYVLSAMEADAGIALSALKVDGGASANNYLMQTQADICAAPVDRPRCVETTAAGAAYLAGLAVGFWKDQAQIQRIRETDRIFRPQLDEETRQTRLFGWKRAVACTRGWAKE